MDACGEQYTDPLGMEGTGDVGPSFWLKSQSKSATSIFVMTWVEIVCKNES